MLSSLQRAAALALTEASARVALGRVVLCFATPPQSRRQCAPKFLAGMRSPHPGLPACPACSARQNLRLLHYAAPLQAERGSGP